MNVREKWNVSIWMKRLDLNETSKKFIRSKMNSCIDRFVNELRKRRITTKWMKELMRNSDQQARLHVRKIKRLNCVKSKRTFPSGKHINKEFSGGKKVTKLCVKKFDFVQVQRNLEIEWFFLGMYCHGMKIIILTIKKYGLLIWMCAQRMSII